VSPGTAAAAAAAAALPLVSLDAIREAAAGLVGVAVRTPLLPADALAERAGVPVFLKLENRQPTGAFKLRGAWTAIRRLPAEAGRRGVITYSSGNHGQAVAYAARRLGIRAVIVMPETAPPAKVAGVRKWGGEVVFAGTTSEDRKARADELIAREGFTVIPPFDHPDVIAGQGTVGLEIAEDLPGVAHVAVPVGGGGQVAGIAAALAALAPGARVTAVEPVGSAAMGAALAAGRVVRLERTHSIADGLLPLAVGALTFAHVKDLIDAVTVTDDAIAEATVWLHREMDLLVEPSGAATTAALRCGALRVSGPTVLVVSGGNVDPADLDRLASQGGG
jgi:threonine dehydratase